MVCFECGKCNETVKKPKLAKHLMMCNSFYVSCIDCNMRFTWDTWEQHTSCISEAQKYQGNLFQAKENKNKGKVKQDSWTENIEQRIADPSSGVRPETKNLLEKLLGFTNVPRKQKPFGNFVKNSLKIWDDRKINDMWAVIAAANEKKAAPAPVAPAPTEAGKPPAEKPAKRSWPGWKQALDEELTASSGEVPWRKLRDALVARYRAEADNVNGATTDDLGYLALSKIPEVYLSREDEFIRFPVAKKQR